MLKKSLTLSLILPIYLLGDVDLGKISVVEEQDRKTNSINVDLLSSEQRQSNSVFELFKNESSIELGGGGSSNAKRIYLRGAESSTLNMTLDGAKQGTNIFQHRGNEIGINPDILKVVDVNTAPDASKGGALGGSVEMSTKDAQDYVKYGKNAGAIFKTGYNTNTDSKLGSLTTYGVYDNNFGIVASISGVNNDNYEDGNNNEMLSTAYKDRNYLVKLSLLDLDNHDLRLSFNQNSNSGEMQWGRDGSDKGVIVDPSLLEKISSTTTNYTLQHNYSDSKLLNLDTNINLTNILVDREDEDLEYENDKLGLKVQNHFYVDLADTKNKFSLGFDIEDEETTGMYACSPANGGSDCLINKYAPTSSLNQALFIQNTTSIYELDIHYGFRFDDYELETGFGKAEDTTYSPNIGLEYKINESSNVFANYGQSSRMSGTIPFTWMTNIKKNTTYSKELEAEKSARYELGYSYKQDALFASDDTFKFDATIFKTELKDMIVGKAIDGNFGAGGRTLVDIYNFDYDFKTKGFEVKGAYFIDNYFTSLAYTQVDSNVFDEKKAGIAKEPLAIRRVGTWDNQKLVFNAGAEFFNSLSIDYTLTAVAGIDEADQITRGGYTTHDISTMYRSNEDSAWTFYLAVSNLTDKYYAPHTTLTANDGTYRRDMGRDFKFSIKYEL